MVAAGVQVLTISGPARAVLTGERTALNFVGRLSGIATLTADYVRHTAGTKMRICCTRKTTPGLRALEKYAVRCGGGFNHRFGLDDAILIKDNHIAVAGGVTPVLQRARAHIGHLVKIEIEVDTLAQLREVLDTGLADVVLLDNMDIADADRGGEAGQGPRGAGGFRRRHARLDREDRGDRRGLCLVRRADAFGAEFRCRARYRRLASSLTPHRLSDISAELLAAPASSAEISAVCAGVPQLGASLPSPQARGR